MALLTKHYLISGRVQGVGYRAFARARAVELELAGWVRNLADGRVESVARGPVETLTRFEEFLKKGPLFGRVDSLQCEEWPEDESLSSFEVRKDGPAA
jgi:acylphosphatase